MNKNAQLGAPFEWHLLNGPERQMSQICPSKAPLNPQDYGLASRFSHILLRRSRANCFHKILSHKTKTIHQSRMSSKYKLRLNLLIIINQNSPVQAEIIKNCSSSRHLKFHSFFTKCGTIAVTIDRQNWRWRRFFIFRKWSRRTWKDKHDIRQCG